jgi:hypothetical protein
MIRSVSCAAAFRRGAQFLAVVLLAGSIPTGKAFAAEAGDVIAVNNIGVPLYTHNFDTGKDVGVGDKLLVSEFIGGHYFITDTVRVGMMVQFTEQYTGDVAKGADHFTTLAFLPQVGWHFCKRLYVAAIFTYAPRAGGKDQLDLGLQALFGGSIPVTKNASLGLALEIPYNFYVNRTVGFTPLVGLTYKL